MKTIFPILLLVCLFAVSGCYYKGKASDLVGTYQADIPPQAGKGGGFEQLELLPDGRCMQKIQLAYGETYLAQGTWEWNPYATNYYYICFRKIRLPLWAGKLNKDLADEPKGIISRPVFRGIFGGPKIMFREGYYYKKIK